MTALGVELESMYVYIYTAMGTYYFPFTSWFPAQEKQHAKFMEKTFLRDLGL